MYIEECYIVGVMSRIITIFSRIALVYVRLARTIALKRLADAVAYLNYIACYLLLPYSKFEHNTAYSSITLFKI